MDRESVVKNLSETPFVVNLDAVVCRFLTAITQRGRVIGRSKNAIRWADSLDTVTRLFEEAGPRAA